MGFVARRLGWTRAPVIVDRQKAQALSAADEAESSHRSLSDLWESHSTPLGSGKSEDLTSNVWRNSSPVSSPAEG